MPTTIKVLKFSYVHFSTPRMSNCGWLTAFGNICRLSGRKETESARSIYCKDYADQNYNQYIIIIIYTIIIIYCKDYAELCRSLHTSSVKPSHQMPLLSSQCDLSFWYKIAICWICSLALFIYKLGKSLWMTDRKNVFLKTHNRDVFH